MLLLMAGIVYTIINRALWGEPEQVQVHNME